MSKYEDYKSKITQAELDGTLDKDFIKDMKSRIASHEALKKSLYAVNMDFASLYPSSVSGSIKNQHYENIEKIERYI